MSTSHSVSTPAPPDALSASIASYDGDSDGYAAQYEAIDVGEFVRWVTDRQPPDSVVLDVGCGSGRDAAAFAAMGYRTLGIDLSDGMLHWARQHHPHVDFVRGDSRSLPIADASARVVWAMASLVHLEVEDVTRAMTEFRRVLVSGGTLFVSVPWGKESGWRPSRCGERWFRYFESDTVSELVQECGFHVEVLDEKPGLAGGRWINLLATR